MRKGSFRLGKGIAFWGCLFVRLFLGCPCRRLIIVQYFWNYIHLISNKNQFTQSTFCCQVVVERQWFWVIFCCWLGGQCIVLPVLVSLRSTLSFRVLSVVSCFIPGFIAILNKIHKNKFKFSPEWVKHHNYTRLQEIPCGSKCSVIDKQFEPKHILIKIGYTNHSEQI